MHNQSPNLHKNEYWSDISDTSDTARITYILLITMKISGFDNLVQLIIWCGCLSPLRCLLRIGCWPWFSFNDNEMTWNWLVDSTAADLQMNIRITDVIWPMMIIMLQIVWWYKKNVRNQNVIIAEIESSARDKSPNWKSKDWKKMAIWNWGHQSSKPDVMEGQFWNIWRYDWNIDDAMLEYKRDATSINQISQKSELNQFTSITR